jgi:inosose dehydratase
MSDKPNVVESSAESAALRTQNSALPLLSRRRFVLGMGVAAAASALPTGGLAAGSDISFGCAAITWGGDDTKAIDEVAELGFRGIQLRSNAVAAFSGRTDALRELLARRKLELVTLSSGNVGEGDEAEDIARHARNAAFLRDAGGRYLQLIDAARPKGRKPEAGDFTSLARRMSEIGKRAADLGVRVGYHHHMDSLGEAPDEVARVMDAVDRRHVKLALDVAHYFQGGGDPARAIRQYKDDLLYLHIKDVERPVPGDPSKPYRFVELGRGRVDLPAVFAALREVKFRGWAIVELDAVPDGARTPKEANLVSKRYLEEKIGLSVAGGR